MTAPDRDKELGWPPERTLRRPVWATALTKICWCGIVLFFLVWGAEGGHYWPAFVNPACSGLSEHTAANRAEWGTDAECRLLSKQSRGDTLSQRYLSTGSLSNTWLQMDTEDSTGGPSEYKCYQESYQPNSTASYSTHSIVLSIEHH